MYELVRLEVNADAINLLDAYESLVPKELSSLLLGKDPQDPNSIILAYGILCETKPVGIILASCNQTLERLDIRHFFVHPSYRNQQLGHRLLLAILEEAKKLNIHFFFLLYPSEESWSPALEKILIDVDWKIRPFMIRCLYDVDTFDTPWIHKDYHYPQGYEEFLWLELSTDEKQQLHIQQIQRAFPAAVSPFFEEDRIEPRNSLGLRFQGRIVGWIITHRIDPETIRYTTLFVERSLWHTGISMKLLADSIHLHLKNKTKWAILEIPLLQVHSSWVRFANRRLLPYADKVTHLMQAWNYVAK